MRVSDVRLAAALGALALILSGCSSSTESPVATTVTITPAAAVNFVSINATTTLHAKVLDQNGDSMPGVAIAWSTSDATKATVDAISGLVTAKGNGTATITATSGGAHSDKTVTVAQAATTAVKSGDAQTGTAGAALTNAIAVHLTDAGGSAVAGASVVFAVTAGLGNLGNANATTNATGDATTTWTLGSVAGAPQSVSATAGALVASFTATANAGATSAIAKQAGDGQTRVVSAPVATAPSAKVTDSFGNAKAGVPVVFAVTGGGGSIQGGSTYNTNASGIATVGGWTMGSSAGANTLSATVQGTAITTTFNATAVTAGAPANIAVAVGNGQTALVGYATNFRPAVLVTDANNQPASGVSVTFAVTGGGGSVTNATVNTNALGIAQVGKWTVGGVAGANTMTATAAPSGITGNPIAFSATGVQSGFNIVVVNYGPAFSPAVQAAFDSAVAFWQRAIIGDLPDLSSFTSHTAGACQAGEPATGPVIDDVVILAKFDSIDGVNGILGSAGPCFVRTTGGQILSTIDGVMRFDTADVAGLINNGSLNSVIRHEMGHVLGIGTYWPGALGTLTGFGCLQNAASGSNHPDTYFSCPNAQAAFDSIGGVNYTGGLKVPVENCGAASPAGCGSGTVNSHWREPVFGNELMTGYLNAGVNPMSVMSIASLLDLGLVVNYGAAETYSKVFTSAAALRAGTAPVIVDLSNDIREGPLYFVDQGGRIVGVARLR